MNKLIGSIFAIIIGIFLLIKGIWGETSNVVFGVLTTNRIHATIHTLLGIEGQSDRGKIASTIFRNKLNELIS